MQSLDSAVIEKITGCLSARPGYMSSRNDLSNRHEQDTSDIGTRLYNNAKAMAEKKDILRKRIDSNCSFTPVLSARYHKRKDKENRLVDEIAVVSSCDAISFSALQKSGLFANAN